MTRVHELDRQGRLLGRQTLRDAVIALMDRHGLEAVVFPYKTLPAQKLAQKGEGAAPAVAVGVAGVAAAVVWLADAS